MTRYAMVTNTDLTEGRGAQYVVAFFSTPEAAIKAAKGAGVMGTDAYAYQVEETQVWDSFEDWEACGRPQAPRNGYGQGPMIFGYHLNYAGKWVHGIVEEAPVDDPDYQKYLALKKRFEG